MEKRFTRQVGIKHSTRISTLANQPHQVQIIQSYQIPWSSRNLSLLFKGLLHSGVVTPNLVHISLHEFTRARNMHIEKCKSWLIYHWEKMANHERKVLSLMRPSQLPTYPPWRNMTHTHTFMAASPNLVSPPVQQHSCFLPKAELSPSIPRTTYCTTHTIAPDRGLFVETTLPIFNL